MHKQQYQAIRSRLRENSRSTTHVAHFPVEQRDDIVKLLKLRDRCDMLACRATRFEFEPNPSLSARLKILTSTAPSRVLNRLYGAAA